MRSSQSSSWPIRARSRWLVGSSSRSTSGSATHARASMAILSQPPLRADSARSRNAVGTSSDSSATSTRQASLSAWSAGSARQTASWTVSSPRSRGMSCSTKPTRRPRVRVMSPEVGSTVPAMQRKRVDFPRPLAATTPSRSPAAIERLRFEKSGAWSVIPSDRRLIIDIGHLCPGGPLDASSGTHGEGSSKSCDGEPARLAGVPTKGRPDEML